MRDVAIVSFALTPSWRRSPQDDVEMVHSVCTEARAAANIGREEIGLTVSGSCDMLVGRPFSFVMALDGVGAWPPISESHVEMDGAWALYEAWVRLQHGDIDAAIVYAFGRSSSGDLPDVMVTQLDPYCVAPLWPDSVSVAALQARALLDSGRYTERDFAQVVARSRRDAKSNPKAGLSGDYDVEALLEEPYKVAPLRRHDCPPITDGAAAVVLVAGALAERVERPAWIRGIDHRIDPHSLGLRDLTRSPSTELAAQRAGVSDAAVDLVEIHAPFSHQELILRDAILPEGAAAAINPSGGALASNPMMVAGLARIGEAAKAIHEGRANRAVGHATSGPALQQNLVCVLEGE
jgi:acetyl-CoA acetyltransferase